MMNLTNISEALAIDPMRMNLALYINADHQFVAAIQLWVYGENVTHTKALGATAEIALLNLNNLLAIFR